MLPALVVSLRSLALICRGHQAIALENLALRQQLAVFKRTVRLPELHHRDRLFWILLANTWRDWQTICGPRGGCQRQPLTADPGRWTWRAICLTLYDDYAVIRSLSSQERTDNR